MFACTRLAVWLAASRSVDSFDYMVRSQGIAMVTGGNLNFPQESVPVMPKFRFNRKEQKWHELLIAVWL